MLLFDSKIAKVWKNQELSAQLFFFFCLDISNFVNIKIIQGSGGIAWQFGGSNTFV